MGILVAALILCITCAVLLSETKIVYTLRRRIFYFFAFILIFSVRTFVEPSSLPDLPVYQDVFELSNYASLGEILKGEYLSVGEIGFLLLCKLSSIISDNFHFLLAIISVIWICLYFNLFKKYSPYYAVPVLLLLVTEFPQSLFVLRQHLAIAVWLFAYSSIINRDFKTFLLIAVIATSFHTTGLIFFPIYFLYGMMSKKSFFLCVLLLSVCVLVGFAGLNLINGAMGLSYDNYISGERSGESNLTVFMIRTMYFISYWYFCRTKIFEPGIYRLITTIMILSIIIAFWGTSFSLTGRIVRYFTPACMLLVPIVMKHIQSKYIRYSYFICIMLLNVYMIFGGSMSEFIKDYTWL